MSSIVATAFLWLLVALALGLLGLVATAWQVERRHGLPRSTQRLGLVAMVVVAMLVVALRDTTILLAPPPRAAAPAPPQPNRELPPEVAAKLKDLEERRRQIDEEIAQIRRAHAPRQPVVDPEGEPGRGGALPAPSTGTGLALAAALVAVAVALAFALGRRDTLPWLSRLAHRGARDASSLDDGAHATLRGDFTKALELLDPIPEGGQALPDQLDMLFVRAFAALSQAGATGAGAPTRDQVQALLVRADRDAARLVEIAPDMPEARYLLATVRAMAGRHAEALADFERCRDGLDEMDLPHSHNESVCMIELASKALESGDADQARSLFERVAKLRVLADQVGLTVLSHRLTQLRAAIRARDVDRARSLLAEVRATEGLEPDAAARAATVCDVYELMMATRASDDRAAITKIRAFLDATLPRDLPEVDDQVADEVLFPYKPAAQLTIPSRAFGTLFFWLAAAETRARCASGRPLNEASAAPVVHTLLRALQFAPRQRDILATLGCITYWFLPAKRSRGLEWVRSSLILGVRSNVVRRVLERERVLASERGAALERLLDASSRFLVDPTVMAGVRTELARELGRFDAFQPLLVELGVLPNEAAEPTITAIRERARYVSDLVERSRDKGAIELQGLEAAQATYQSAIERLESSVKQINQLERQIMLDLGRAVLRWPGASVTRGAQST